LGFRDICLLTQSTSLVCASCSSGQRFALLRYGLIGSGAPVVVMVLSIPLAFVSPNLALLSWLVMFPLGIAIDRAAPPELETLKRRDP
jgi:hypothetical protein